MFFQRKNSKKVKDSNGSSSKDKDGRGKNIFYSAKGGLGALAGNLQTAKNDTEESAGNLQEDVKTTIGAIMHKGPGILEKAKEIGGHSEASQSEELGQGSEEQRKKDMEAFNKVIEKVKEVKSNPEVVEKLDKAKEDITNLAHALHLGKHDKEHESEKAKEGETAKNADESASASKSEDSGVMVQAVEEIQAVVTAAQQQLHTGGAAAESPNEAAAAETSAEGEKPEESKRNVEKDDPSKRLDFMGYIAMLFERCCNTKNKKKD